MTWIVQRIIQAFAVIIISSILVFIAVNVIGNPIDILISPDADQRERAQAIARLGLDRPLWEQYWNFLGAALQGDFGTSYIFNRPALGLIWQRLPATLELATAALIVSVVLGIPLGLYAGLKPESTLSRFLMAGSIFGFSLPSFWVGLVLIMVFAVNLGWLPSNGRGDTVTVLGAEWSFLTWDGLRHMILPVVNLALLNVSLIMRLTRAGVREILPLDYIKFARAKGLSSRRVIGVHVLKPVLIPVVTVVGLEFGSLIAFSVVTESVFSWPGMGKLIVDSINLLDRPVIVAYLMVVVCLFVFINLFVDIAYTLLDPRVRLGGAS